MCNEPAGFVTEVCNEICNECPPRLCYRPLKKFTAFYIYIYIYGCGSIFWCGTFRGDADVWNESVTQRRLFRTSGRTCVESSSTRSFSVRWIDGWLNGWVDGWMKRPAARGLTIRHLLEGFLGGAAGRNLRGACGCVCVRACGLGGKLLRCVWNTSGTGLERGLERLRECCTWEC